jgi:aminoglycoside phosphotransferase (APT) family kinase protein
MGEREEIDLGELLAEARDNYAAVAAHPPPPDRPAIEAFLDGPLPAPPASLAFCHNDLGIEHVLVEPQTMAITGVIDWSDAAVADPARDLGLILRDLGPGRL